MAWLLIVSHALFALAGAFVFVLLLGVGVVAQDAEAAMILLVVGTSVAGLLVVLAIPGLAAACGLLARKS